MPGRLGGLKDVEKILQRPLTQRSINMVAFLECTQSTFTHILMITAPDHVVQQSLTQGPLREAHTFDFETVKSSTQNCQTCRENRRPVRLETIKHNPANPLKAKQLLFKLVQIRPGDAVLPPCCKDVTDRFDGARRTGDIVPAMFPISLLNMDQLQAGTIVRFVKLFLGHMTIGKVFLGPGDTSHIKTLQQQRFKAFTNNELCTATADINHQLFATVIRLRVGYPQINQPRLFSASNNIDRMP